MSEYFIKPWGVSFGRFSLVWRDLWLKEWCFEVVWNHKRILPRPKPVKLTVCSSTGEVKGTFIPAAYDAKQFDKWARKEAELDVLADDVRKKHFGDDWPEYLDPKP